MSTTLANRDYYSMFVCCLYHAVAIVLYYGMHSIAGCQIFFNGNISYINCWFPIFLQYPIILHKKLSMIFHWFIVWLVYHYNMNFYLFIILILDCSIVIVIIGNIVLLIMEILCSGFWERQMRRIENIDIWCMLYKTQKYSI